MTTDPNQLTEVISQHPRLVAVAAFCALIAGFVALWSALLEMEALDLVNTKLPPDKQHPVLGNFQYFAVRSEYEKLFPGGTLLQKSDKAKLLAITIFLGGMFLQVLLNRLWPL
jgi:hypothetical protein